MKIIQWTLIAAAGIVALVAGVYTALGADPVILSFTICITIAIVLPLIDTQRTIKNKRYGENCKK